MGKGGGGSSQPTRSTTVSTSLPEYAEPFYTSLLERTEAESRRPYEPYGGQRFEQFTPLQEESFQAATNVARQGIPPAMRAATLKAADVAGYQQPYMPTDFGVGSFTDPGVAGRYMNPFVENVIDVQRRRGQERFEEDVVPGLRAQAVRQGAFGGSRAALQEGLARERLETGLSDQEAALRAQAYQGAQGLYTTEAGRQLREQQLADLSAQQASRLGIAGGELGLRSAAQLAALGGLEQQTALRSADVLRQVGEQEQAERQAMLDIGYSDFLSQRDYPRRQISYLGGIMHGVPVSPETETSMYQRPPGAGQQLMGYGLGGLGLARSIFGQG